MARKKGVTKTKVKKTKDLPATYEALDFVRKELKSDISSLEKKMKYGFNQVDAKFNQMDSKFSQMNAKFEKVYVELEKMNSTTQRTLALMEEQNTRNKASYEGSEVVRVHYENLEERVSALEEFRHDITKRLK